MVAKSDSSKFQSKPQNPKTVGYVSVIPDKVISTLSSRATTASTSTLSNTVRPIHHRLRAMIPEDFDRGPNASHKGTSGLIKMDGNVQHVSLAVFLLTNNLVATDEVAEVVGLFVGASDVQLLRSLLAIQTPTVEALSESLLLGALQSENVIVVQTCLEAGANSNSTLLGRTALQYVAGKANIWLVQVLLKAKADVNAPPAHDSGRTALQAAVGSGNIKLVQILLKAGAHVNALAAGYAGATALQVASLRSYVRVATKLLDAGADPDAAGALSEGRTALEGAAEHGCIDMVQLLLNAGVALRKGDVQYDRTLQLTSRNGHGAVQKLVETHCRSSCTGDSFD
jgi:hypothetical protein